MSRIKNKSIVLFLLFAICSVSCIESEILNDSNEPEESKMQISNYLKTISFDWGKSAADMKPFDGLNIDVVSDDIIQYHMDNVTIAYCFSNQDLISSIVIVPIQDLEDYSSILLDGFSYLGNLENGSQIFTNKIKNTISSVYKELIGETEYYEYVYFPIQSDYYEFVPPIEITSYDNPVVDGCFATISGIISGVEGTVEAGIVYGKELPLDINHDKKVSQVVESEFNIVINGLYPESQYYYCPYVLVEDIYYWGPVKSLIGGPLSYFIDEQEFSLVKVEYDEGSDFYIMQTECPPNSQFSICNKVIGVPNKHNDAGLIKAEFLRFLRTLQDTTGLSFRLPHKEEWLYAAKGGNKTQSYTYSGSNNIDEVAWYKDNSENEPHPVAQKLPNELGLYDMSGNYAEICYMEEKSDYDVDGDIMGGSWKQPAGECYSSSSVSGDSAHHKIPGSPYYEYNVVDCRYISFRLVLEVEP